MNSVVGYSSDVNSDRLLEDAVVVGVHIPKCAGTTFTRICRRHFPPHKFYVNSDPIGFHVQRLPEFATLNFHTIRAIFGHFIYEEMLKFIPSNRAIVLFTGLRDPALRSRSEFYWARKFSEKFNRTPPSFEEWATSKQYHNRMCNWLVKNFPSFIDHHAETLADKAISVLQKFDLVYDTQFFDRDIGAIFQLLGIKSAKGRFNITKYDKKISVIEDIINEINNEDITLYRYFLDHSEFVPQDLNELHRRVSANHRLRFEILGCEPNLHAMYQNLYMRKKGVYRFSGKLHEIVADKVSELHSLTYELGCYVRDGDDIRLNSDEKVMLDEVLGVVQSIAQQDFQESKNRTIRIRQKRNIEQELDALRKELDAIYVSRGYRALEKIRAIRRNN